MLNFEEEDKMGRRSNIRKNSVDEIHPPRESASARRRSDKQAQKQLQKERKRGNRQILFITYAFVTLFLAMAGIFGVFYGSGQ